MLSEAEVSQVITTLGQVVIAIIALAGTLMLRKMDLRQKEIADRQAIRDRHQEVRDRKAVVRVNQVRKALIESTESQSQKLDEVKSAITSVTSSAASTAADVADVLGAATAQGNEKLDGLAKVAQATHTLVNSNMAAQLLINKTVTRRLAMLTEDQPSHPADVAAADEAERLYDAHQAKQHEVDEQHGTDAQKRGETS